MNNKQVYSTFPLVSNLFSIYKFNIWDKFLPTRNTSTNSSVMIDADNVLDSQRRYFRIKH